MKVGVIGTGNMGENHVKTYLSLQEHCQLVGIYDIDSIKAQQIAKKYQVKQFQSIDDLLQAVDAVSIAVPTKYHYEVGLNCIKHNVHMLMEKPIASTIKEAEDLIQKAYQAGIKLQIGHIELFNPFIQFLTQELKDETIIGMSIHRMSPYDERMKNVDVVNDLMIHDIYIVNKLLNDNNITEYYALGKTIDNTTKHAVVIMKSAKGVTAHLTASFKSKKKIRTIQILTEESLIEADILNQRMNITRSVLENKSNTLIPVTETIDIDDTLQPLTIQLTDFLNCIKKDTVPTVPGEEGLRVLTLTNEIKNAI